MENASKALIMAGSVFLALMIIGALVFMFNSLSDLKQTEEESDEVMKIVQYNKQIESFNKSKLYGSEILSLANLIDDYNKREIDSKIYTPITLKITMTPIIDAEYIKKTSYTVNKNNTELLKDFNNLETKVNELKGEVICGKTIEEFYGMKTQAIYNAVENYIIKNNKNYSIQDKVLEIEKKVDKYSDLRSELTNFKLKVFKNVKVSYNGSRISEIIFEEKK